MIAYLIRRGAAGAAVMLALVVLAFLASHYVGDPVNMMVDSEYVTDAEYDVLREAGGYNRPMHEQFWDFFSGAIRGDFGDSVWQNRPATEIVAERLPATLLLGGVCIVVTFMVAIPAAVISAYWSRSWVATVITTVTTGFASVASFWVALALIFVFAIELKWLPTSGYGQWQHMVLPVIALAIAPIGRFTQILEASVTNELREPYVSTARAKGLRETRVIYRHVLRNALIVGVTLLGGEVIFLLNGAVLIETIFAWPGIGNVALESAQQRDLPVLMASVVLVGLLVVVVNLAVDVAYAAIDPRVRLT